MPRTASGRRRPPYRALSTRCRPSVLPETGRSDQETTPLPVTTFAGSEYDADSLGMLVSVDPAKMQGQVNAHRQRAEDQDDKAEVELDTDRMAGEQIEADEEIEEPP